jgi:hypothetical protein
MVLSPVVAPYFAVAALLMLRVALFGKGIGLAGRVLAVWMGLVIGALALIVGELGIAYWFGG